jgi:hypothetical protein
VSRPPELRVSDADRERIAERLRDAAGEGRLTIEELDERLDRAYKARTASDLAELTTDLPATAATGGTGVARPGGAKQRRWLISVWGGGNLRGRWRAGRHLNAVSVMSGGDIDLRDAELESGELTITAIAVMGGIDVIVPAGVDAELSGFALMGGNDCKVPSQDLPPGAPRVRVRAFSLMGGIDLRMGRREPKQLLGGE